MAALVVVGAATAGMVSAAAGPVIGLVAESLDVEPDVDGVADLPTLAERSVVRDADGGVMAELHDVVDRRVVALDDVPAHVRHAVLAAEDRRFFDHDGYDPQGILRAGWTNVTAGEIAQGASTITQQVVRQAHLDRDETIERKVQEVAHAIALEERLSKDEILERYLNEVYLGAGAYGVAAAADEYFRAAPEDLTVDQAALLAGLIRAPGSLQPREHPDRATERRDQVLALMAEAGFLTADEAQARQDEPLDLAPPLEQSSDQPYALEAVKREIAAIEQLGDDRDERLAALFTGGLQVHTTLDRDLQEMADAAVEDALPGDGGPTAALVALDPRNEAIRALHGGVDFDDTKFDLATQARRQPGSALKPLVAAAALEQGLARDARFEGTGPVPFALPHDDEPWEVDNFGGADHGTVDLSDALVRSANTAFAQLGMAVGAEEIAASAERFGIDAEAAFGPPDTRGPSIALGGLTRGVTPLELATVYGTFADQGRTGPPHLVKRIEGPDGEVVYERKPQRREHVIDAGTNAVMVDALRGVVEEGTGAAAQLDGWDVLGKTGTTDDHTDAWFAGATATLSTAVWVGHPDQQVPMDGMTGGALPARLWHDFNERALADQQPTTFPDAESPAAPPDPDATEVPDLAGRPVAEAVTAAADAGTPAVFADGAGRRGRVVGQRPGPGTMVDVGEPVELRTAGAAQ